jgi:diguanylate cyclase (GGDEF)-like protein
MSIPVPQAPQVLVATSNPNTSRQLITLLEEWQYPHILVEDGVSALRFLTQPQPPAIALLDSALPSITGLQVIHSLRQRYEQSQTWLMLLGSVATPEDVQTATDAGADDFILQPLNSADLRSRLRVAERVLALTQRVRSESEAARFYSNHDALTGLLTRESALKKLFCETDRARRMNTTLAYLLLDLDSFSLINLNYGYSVGDQVLAEIGQRLRRHLRAYDLAGRYGEDEFLIGLPGCSIDSQIPMSERLRKAVLDRPFDIGKDRVRVSASIGVVQSMGRSPLIVIREVESALARAKMEGRNCIRDSVRIAEPNIKLADSDPMLQRITDTDFGKPN